MRMRHAPSLRRTLVRLAAVFAAFVVAVTPCAAFEVQRVRANGLEAWLVEDHSQPIVAVHLAFRGGAALDPEDKVGLAAMMMALLDEGAGELDEEAFHARLEDLAADLRFSADRDALTASLRTLSQHREEAFALLSLALLRPRFEDKSIERVRSQMLATLKRRATDPEAVASRRFFATVFPDHPYGRPVDGSEETLNRIGRADLVASSRARLARSTLVVGIAGDMTAVEAADALTRTFADLPATAAAANVPDVKPAARGGTTVVRLAAPQSAVMFGQVGLRWSDPGFYALAIVNQVLGGGGLSSRLFEEVREKRGLAYSVYTNPLPFDRAALWVGRAATANERVAETLAVIRGEWQRLQRDGLTETEVEDAKTYLTGSFPLRLTSNSQLAGMLVSMQLQGLPIDWLDRRNTLISAITREEVNRLAATLMDPESLTFVVAGQPAGLE